MHLQGKHCLTFDLDLGFKVVWSIVQYPQHYVTYEHAKFEGVKEEMHLQEKAIYDLWAWSKGQGHRKYCPVPSTLCDLCICKVWSNCIKWLRRCIYKKIHHLTFDIYPRPQGQGQTKCCSVPSTLCDLCTCKVCSCYVWRFSRRYIYKKPDGRTDRQTDGGPTLVKNL